MKEKVGNIVQIFSSIFAAIFSVFCRIFGTFCIIACKNEKVYIVVYFIIVHQNGKVYNIGRIQYLTGTKMRELTRSEGAVNEFFGYKN